MHERLSEEARGRLELFLSLDAALTALDTAEAEIERLRKGLRELIEAMNPIASWCYTPGDPMDRFLAALNRARGLLPEHTTEEGERRDQTADAIRERALVLAEFLIRLNIRPTACPDVREAAAMEALVNDVFRLLPVPSEDEPAATVEGERG